MPLLPRFALALLLLLSGGLLPQRAEAQLPGALEPRVGTIAGTIRCRPGFIELPGEAGFETRNPIAIALELAAPGCLILLADGDYPRLGIGINGRAWWNARQARGTPLSPIVVRGSGRSRILPGDAGDTLGIDQKGPTGWITFERVDFVAGYRAGIFFYDLPDNSAHEGFKFYDCNIDGEWDHFTDSGPHSSKWGVLGHDLKDFVFAGTTSRVTVENIRQEHGFYLQSPRGDITLERIDGRLLGRTFVQLTARQRSGPPGSGRILIRDCTATDVGVAKGDAFKGGSAFTFAGRLTNCTIELISNTYRAGFDRAAKKLTTKNAPYGSGALVAWDGAEGAMNGRLILRGNDFERATGCGDRALVSIGACRSVQVTGSNRFVSGSRWAALELDPVGGDGKLKNLANGQVVLEQGLTLDGALRVRKRDLSPAEVAERLTPPASGDPGSLPR